MTVERWLAPLSGAVALGTAAGVVGLWVYGGSLPEVHEATVRAEVRQPPEVVWPLLADFSRRPEWAPGIARIAAVDAIGGSPAWREFDAAGDRFDLAIDEATWPRLRYRTAKPEDVGMDATWTWTLEPHPTGTRLTLTEEGRIANPLYRAIWELREGPEAAIREDLGAFVAWLRAGPPPAPTAPGG